MQAFVVLVVAHFIEYFTSAIGGHDVHIFALVLFVGFLVSEQASLLLSVNVAAPAETKETFLDMWRALVFADVIRVQLRDEALVFFVGEPCVSLGSVGNEIQ